MDARLSPTRRGSSAEIWLVLGLLLLAAFFRLYQLDSVPRGLAPDLAFNGQDARDVIAGHWSIFFPRNSGREALFIYLQTLILAGAGFRLVSFVFAGAAVGLLGVAAAYRLWKALFGWKVGLLAALLLGVSFWDVASNRVGFRVNSLLPLLAISMYLLWRTLVSGRSRYAVACGVAVGLTLYTYTASRLLPLLVVACCLCAWKLAWKRLRQLGLVALTAALVFAPEGVYFLRHPEEFLSRSQGVASASPMSSILATIGMFYQRGDTNPTWNLIGRPVFEPWAAVLFALGILVALWGSRRAAAPRWALCWLVIMLVPAAITVDAPNSQRALGAAPAVFLFPVLALAAVCAVLPWRKFTFPALGLAVAVLAVRSSFGAYFDVWANDGDAYGGTDVSRLHLAEFVAGTSATRTYFADSDITGHVVRMFVPTTEQDGWIPESSAAIPLPSHLEGDTLYISATSAALKDLAPRWLPGVQEWPHPNNPLGKPDFYAFTWRRQDAAALLARLTPVDQQLGDDFSLVSYGFQQSAGDGLAGTIVWRPRRPSGPYDMYIHVLDQTGRVVAQSDRLVWPVRDFRNSREGLGPLMRGYFDEGAETDDWLLTQHDVNVPAGSYTAEIGLAHRDPANPDNVTAGVASIRVPLVKPPAP